MSQQAHSQDSRDHGAPATALFFWASELEAEDLAASREERLQRLGAAGILFTSQSGCEEAPRTETDICGPAPSYPWGVSPANGSLNWGA
jgi:hypothetical protein